jgi:small-conductance mechanosensitive channel
MELWQWLALAGTFVAAAPVAYVLERLLLALGRKLVRLTRWTWDTVLVEAAKGPLKLFLFAALVGSAAGFYELPERVEEGVHFVCRSLMILAFAWGISRGTNGLSRAWENALLASPARVGDTAGLRTQLVVLNRVAAVVISLVTGALLLIQVPMVRSVGTALLASAGFAGLVVGIAAQKSLGAIVSGIQLSLTQPVRIGDEVVVEGEMGNIEAISLTHVVLRAWDQRRLVFPISYFLEKPFQNWSKGPPELLGTVLLPVDFTADIDVFRAQLTRILEESRDLWDEKTASIQVTEVSERTQTFRVLVGGKSSGALFDLRCRVRERLIQFLQTHPGWLPTQRTNEVSVNTHG